LDHVAAVLVQKMAYKVFWCAFKKFVSSLYNCFFNYQNQQGGHTSKLMEKEILFYYCYCCGGEENFVWLLIALWQ